MSEKEGNQAMENSMNNDRSQKIVMVKVAFTFNCRSSCNWCNWLSDF